MDKIEFTCKCGTNYSKTKRALNISGPFCKDCTQRNTAIKKIKNKIAVNNEMLKN
jgi:predicted SprT family Zn-dependent metalloprotease